MDQTTITLLTAVISGTLGGGIALAGVALNARSNGAQQKQRLDHDALQSQERLLRDKSEELYQLVDVWLSSLFGFYNRRNFLMRGKVTYNDVLDGDITEGKSRTANFGRIEILIDVYCPSVREVYDRVIIARTTLNSIETKFKRAYETGNIDGSPFLESYLQAQKAIEDDGRVLKEQIIDCLRRL